MAEAIAPADRGSTQPRDGRWVGDDSQLFTPRREGCAARSRTVQQRLLEAATQAVNDCGLDGLNADAVAVRAGCSRATVYRQLGGRKAIREAVLLEAIDHINALVAISVADLRGDDRTIKAICTSLDVIRANPVAAALLVGPAAGLSVKSDLITQITGSIAELTGLPLADGAGCELMARVALSLLTWPGGDPQTELAIIRRSIRPERQLQARPRG